jgi:hypothetical protein
LNNGGGDNKLLHFKIKSSGPNHSQEEVSLSKEEWEGSSQTIFLVRRIEEGMEVDHLLCARSGRSISSHPLSELGGVYRNVRLACFKKSPSEIVRAAGRFSERFELSSGLFKNKTFLS